MTNIKKCDKYNISLDLGTGSVGWSVQDMNGDLLKYKKKRTWGSRLFAEAASAKNRRSSRGARRKYIRRRQRIDALQSIFEDEVLQVDSEFFNRLKYSKLHIEDKNEFVDGKSKVLFKEYYKYKTIYHLRLHLLGYDVEYDANGNYVYDECGNIKINKAEKTVKEDIRLIYLALHHIAKYRGHYLYDNFTLGSKENSADMHELVCNAVKTLKAELIRYVEFCNREGIDFRVSESKLVDASMLEALVSNEWKKYAGNINQSKKNEAKGVQSSRDFAKETFGSIGGIKDFYKTVIGDKFNWGKLTQNLDNIDKKYKDLKISDDENFEVLLENAPEEIYNLLLATKECNRLYELNRLIKGSTYLSEAFVKRHFQHHKDLQFLKDVYNNFFGTDSTEYHYMFDRELPEGLISDKYNGGYRDYIKASFGQCSYDGLIKTINKDFNNFKGDLSNEWLKELHYKVDYRNDNNFLKKLRTSDNVNIPHQLQKTEAEIIIDRYADFYPGILKDRKEEILNIIFSKIPYYIGPLYNDGKSKNVWNVPKEETDGHHIGYAGIRAWNWENYIDKDATAEKFIRRMTGKCSYLYGEDVLPANSLLYQEYKVRQEINGLKINGQRIDQETSEWIFENIFKKQVSVTRKTVLNKLNNRGMYPGAKEISGFQGKDSFANSLSSFHDFMNIFFDKNEDKDIEDIKKLTTDDIERIVEWNTIFEDRDIFRTYVSKYYGEKRNDGKPPLSKKEIDRIVSKRYKGWGNLSRKFLDELSFGNCNERNTIMKILREGDPTNRYRVTLLEQIKFNKHLNFWEVVGAENNKYFDSDSQNSFNVDELYTSPTWKRTLLQTEKVVDEIIRIANSDRCKNDWIYPKNIFIEITRNEDKSKKNKYTKKRREIIEQLINDVDNSDNFNRYFISEDYLKVSASNQKYELKEDIRKYLDEDMVYLYLQQGGKCMYSDNPLGEITRLAETCDIDHIIPRSMGGQDSLTTNRVLVLKKENQKKSNKFPLGRDIQNKMKSRWEFLHKNGAISDVKFRSLTRINSLTPEEIGKFTEKQLTETSQIVKFAQDMLKEKFKDYDQEIAIKTVRASFISSIRDVCGFPKIRNLNNFHHAHDAYLLGRVGLFINEQFFDRSEDDRLDAYRMFLNRWKKGNRDSYDGFLITKFKDMLEDNGFELDSKIEKDLYSCDVFTSHMVGDNSSGFWDETIRSPLLENKNLKSVLNGRDVPSRVKDDTGRLPGNKYGGNEKVNYAYKACVLVDTSNGKVVELVNIPVWVDRSNDSISSLLDEYIENNLETTDFSSFEIKRKIFCDKNFGTDIDINGCRFIIGGNSKKTNTLRGNCNLVPVIEGGLHFALGQCNNNLDKILNRLSNSKCDKSTLRRITSIIIKEAERVTKDSNFNSTILTDIILESLYDSVCNQLIEIDWRISDDYLKDHHAMFVSLSLQDKCLMLFRLLMYFNSDKLQVGLLETGRTLDGKEKSKEKYEFKRNIIDLIADNDFSFIDKSFTGMKESRTRVSNWIK